LTQDTTTESDEGRRPELTTDGRKRLHDLMRKVKKLRKTNEILKMASAFSRGSSTRDRRDDPLRFPVGHLA
jgi:transposase-like protein